MSGMAGCMRGVLVLAAVKSGGSRMYAHPLPPGI